MIVHSGKTRTEIVEEAKKYMQSQVALGLGVVVAAKRVEKKFKKYNLKIV